MTATYTYDVFSTLDSYGTAADWGGYWGKQGPDLLAERLDQYSSDHHMVLGANTYRVFAEMLAASDHHVDVHDPWVTRMRNLPTTVPSRSLRGPLKEWPQASIVDADAIDVVARLKAESPVPLRSHGSLSMNRALMSAGLVDIVQVTIFPVLTGHTGADPVFPNDADFDLELIEHRTLDNHTQQLRYRPIPHRDSGTAEPVGSLGMVDRAMSADTTRASHPDRARSLSDRGGRLMKEIKGIARVKIHPGQLGEWKRLTEQAMEIVRTQDPGTVQYEVFFNDDESEAIVFERYRNADTALAHFANIGHLMEPLMATATVTGEVLGNPNETMRAQLGDGEPKLFTPWMAAHD